MAQNFGATITLKDMFTNPLKKVNESLKKTGNGIDSLSKKYKKNETGASGLIKKIGALGAAYGVMKQVSKSITLASDLAETRQLVSVVFGDMSKDAETWAENYAKTMGFSTLKTKEAIGDMGNLFTGFGMGKNEALEFSKQIIKMGNDLDSFGNLSAKGVDVQKNMISALMGQSEAATAFGVSLLEPQLQVAALDMGYDKYSNTMDQLTKMKIRYHAIEMQSKNAMGDVARNLDTEVGLRRRLKSQIEGLQTNLGSVLLPLQIKALDIGIKTTDFLFKHSQQFEALIPVIIAVSSGIATYYIALKALSFMSVINGLINAYKTQTQATTVVQWALNAAMSANPIGLVVIGLTALGYAGYQVYKHFDFLKTKTLELWDTFKSSAFYSVFENSPLGLAIKAVKKLYEWYQKFKGEKSTNPDIQKELDKTQLEIGTPKVPTYATGNNGVQVSGASYGQMYRKNNVSNTNTNNNTISLNVNNMNVRDDKDIEKIANELAGQINTRLGGAY